MQKNCSIVYLISCSGQNSVKFLLCAVLVSCPTQPPVLHTNQLRTASSGTGLLSMFRLCSLQLYTMTGVLNFVQNLLGPDRQLIFSIKTVSDLNWKTIARPNKRKLVPHQKNTSIKTLKFISLFKYSC